jgi:hypothetical protein
MVEREERTLAAALASAWSHFKWVVGLRDPSELSVEDFRLELAELGLLGRAFGPEEYRAALEEYLGVEITVEELPDAEGGAVAGELAAEGNLAEVVYDDPTGRALVLVRESLRYRPWPAYELSVFHELSHLAAGHPLRVKRARGNGTGSRFRALGAGRLARGERSVLSGDEERGFEGLKSDVLEPEARKRAKWLVLAGTCPEAFEADKADRLT